jgi:hypothetical protein
MASPTTAEPTVDDLARWLTIETPSMDLVDVLGQTLEVSIAWTYDRCVPLDPARLPPQVSQAMLMTAARLFRRRNSVSGFEGFGELGFAPVRGMDADVERLLTRWLDWEFA